uniref:Uncharacterized protein n=1 Tax=Solanum lycopersicum TaxID=4081 RepID=A0A3Q7GCU6_SOLLC
MFVHSGLHPFLSECSVHSGLQTKDVPFIQACISFSVNVPVHSGLQTKDGGGPLLVEGSSAISQFIGNLSSRHVKDLFVEVKMIEDILCVPTKMNH